VRRVGGEAAQPLWGTRLPQPPSQEGRGRCLALLAGCWRLELQHHALWGGPRAGATGAHSPWATPGAPQSLSPLLLPSRTPTPAACLHTSSTRTHPGRTSCAAARPGPNGVCPPSSAPPPSRQRRGSPPPAPAPPLTAPSDLVPARGAAVAHPSTQHDMCAYPPGC
jgi:hypothetical protein